MTWAAVALTVSALVFPFAAEASQIEVSARVAHTSGVSLPPRGRGGNVATSRWIVKDRHARTIGDLLFDCRWVTSSLRLCVAQLTMPLGTIALMGSSRTRFLGQLAVVGGTGHYVGVSGTMLFNAIGVRRYVLQVTY